ncbi:MAG: hypothetical protein ABFD62_05510, partial [Syntrophaceae bacterium]
HFFIMVACIPFVKEDRLDQRQKIGMLCPRIAGLEDGYPLTDIDFNAGPSHFMLDLQEVGSSGRRDLPFFQKRACVLQVYSIILTGEVHHEVSRGLPAK